MFCICTSAGHGRKTGTNLHAALYGVSEKINFLKQNSANNHFNETQNIIIIETDGKNTDKCLTTASFEHLQLMKIVYNSLELVRHNKRVNFRIQWRRSYPLYVFLPAGYSNTGKKPEIALAQIRSLLGYRDQTSDNTDETKLGIKI